MRSLYPSCSEHKGDMVLRWLLICAYALIATGAIHALNDNGNSDSHHTNIEVQEVEKSDEVTQVAKENTQIDTVTVLVGNNLPIRVRTNLDDIAECKLISPNNEVIEFAPVDQSNKRFNKLDSITLYGCGAEIRNVVEDDYGKWELYYKSANGNTGSQVYNVVVQSAINPGDGSDNGNDDPIPVETTTLTSARYGVQIGSEISITLSRRGFSEQCNLQSPQGDSMTLHEEREGIATYPIPTTFVSCRVVITVRDESVLGTWTLCGRRMENGVYSQRCQPADVFLANANNPNQEIDTQTLTSFNHPINYGGSLFSQVRGSGNILSCNVITPKGETIVLTNNSDYPGISFVAVSNTATCRVQFAPSNPDFIGPWTVFGTFNQNNNFRVIRQPLTFFIFDKENPYAQAHNVTNLNPVTHVVNIGNTFMANFSAQGTRDECLFVTNLGVRHNNQSTIKYAAISNKNNGECRVRVGTVTKEMLGSWTLLGRFRRHGHFNEYRLPFDIVAEDPANPIADDPPRDIEKENRQTFNTRFGNMHDVTFTAGRNEVTNSCLILAPDNLQYRLFEGIALPGIEIDRRYNNIACGIIVHVVSEAMNGNWTLIARINTNNARIERRQPFTLNIEANPGGTDIDTMWLTNINYGSRMGSKISIALSRQDFTEDCFLTTPSGDTLNLQEDKLIAVTAYTERTNFVSCRAVIGPMDQSLLGTWTLCGRRTVNGNLQQRCQQAVISWGNPNPNQEFTIRHFDHFDYPVNYGGRQSLQVRGTGSLNTCHVVTPNGEDLVVTPTSNYPGLSLVSVRDTTVCSIMFQISNSIHMGRWELYGTYTSNTVGFNIARQTLSLFLFNEENPYDQAHNVTLFDQTLVLSNIGNIAVANFTGQGTRMNCIFVSNTGERHDNSTLSSFEGVNLSTNNNGECRIRVGPMSERFVGKWSLIGRFQRNGLLNELRLPMVMAIEDPANPVPDNSRIIETAAMRSINTEIGTRHNIFSSTSRDETTDSCHLRTPDNLQFRLLDGFNLPGVEMDRRNSVACGVNINLLSEDLIGEWMLITRVDTRNGLRLERRLPFTIHVEEDVAGLPEEINVAVGSNLHLRLANPSLQPSTCVVEGPTRSNGEVDEAFAQYCGFIIRNITVADNGKWNVFYGKGIKYKATIQVNVIERINTSKFQYTWAKDAQIDQIIGPEETVYCRVHNPQRRRVFEGFGRCHIKIDRVAQHHDGTWNLVIGIAGRVTTDNFDFIVKVASPEKKAPVKSIVETDKPNVMISCQLESEHPITACKFRDPSGRVLLANQGVGEERYTFHGVGVRMRSNITAHQCGLMITNPLISDLGLWRCAVETEVDTFYGFPIVLCPFAMMIPENAAQVVTEPTLTSETDTISAVEGDDVTLLCSVQSSIRYCYFRRQNGTVFNLSPGTSGPFEYVGAGLDAGDCGIRFRGLSHNDSGTWSCHVGFPDSRPEQRSSMNVEIQAMMTARQYQKGKHLVVAAEVHSRRQLEYCRFVRIDGFGFTSNQESHNYEDFSKLNSGHCEIRIKHANILEHHPWTVVVRILGQDVEVARTTIHTIEVPEEGPPVGPEGPGPEGGPGGGIHVRRNRAFIAAWTCVLILSLALFFLGMMLGPRKNRDWTYRRAAAVRDSFRRSFRKVPLEHTVPPARADNNTSSAA